MTPQEKAKEVVNKFYQEIKWYSKAKQCALIAVDEILKSPTPKQEKYWMEVKREIEK